MHHWLTTSLWLQCQLQPTCMAHLRSIHLTPPPPHSTGGWRIHSIAKAASTSSVGPVPINLVQPGSVSPRPAPKTESDAIYRCIEPDIPIAELRGSDRTRPLACAGPAVPAQGLCPCPSRSIPVRPLSPVERVRVPSSLCRADAALIGSVSVSLYSPRCSWRAKHLIVLFEAVSQYSKSFLPISTHRWWRCRAADTVVVGSFIGTHSSA